MISMGEINMKEKRELVFLTPEQLQELVAILSEPGHNTGDLSDQQVQRVCELIEMAA